MFVQSLNGEWQFRQKGEKQWLKGQIPGYVHTDLLANRKIPDPFFEDNEKKVQWVAEADWEYSLSFRLHPRLTEHEKVWLEFDGLDTLAEIRLNGKPVGRTDNQHRRYRFEVKKLLAKANLLEIRFSSPVRYAGSRQKRTPLPYGEPAIPGSTWMRKSPSSFGWDWGPKLPSMGVWRNVQLVGRAESQIEDVQIRQKHLRAGKVELGIAVRLARPAKHAMTFKVKLLDPDLKEWDATAYVGPRKNLAEVKITVPKAKLWWPNGLGGQPLYEVRAELTDETGLLDRWDRRIGLRKIELRQKKDKFGHSFTFVVNGVPIFAKGANWIPADQFPTRLTHGQYRDLLDSARQAHINMLRVWGGGLYEDDQFYELCDEMGILIWQDFMFACGVYPGDKAYLDNVRAEAVDNVRRLRHHACLALWCGNNEMEWGWTDWDYLERAGKKYRDVYEKTFHHLLPAVLKAEDPDRPYWPSSPSSERPFFKAPNGESRGDAHIWTIWHGKKPFSDYREHRPRFCSEFGFQSLPPMDTIARFANPGDWNMTSYVMEHHQRSMEGNGLIIHYLADNFRMPKDFPSLVYLTQLLQAEALRHAVEHWRRCRECAGALYWQLNDTWPAVSWSSIDYFGRWKAAHYAARRFFAPLMISANQQDAKVELSVCNDTRARFEGRVVWALETMEGQVIQRGEKPVSVAAGGVRLGARLDLTKTLSDQARRETVLTFDLIAGEIPISNGMVGFVPSKHLDLPPTKVQTAVREEEGQILIDLRPDALARYVALDAAGMNLRFTDNYFDLPAGRKVSVRVLNPDGAGAEDVAAALGVRSLVDSY